MTHLSKGYIEMVQRFMKDRTRAQFWKTFKRLGEEFQLADVDIQRSLELQKRFASRPRQCYYNSTMIALAMSSGLDYMEGIATNLIPTEHAWLIDRAWNRVIDVTWVPMHQRARTEEHKIKDYFGVRIPLAIVKEIVKTTEVAGPMLWLCMDQLKDTRRLKRPVE